MVNNLTVIIRSVGERTEKICKELFVEEVGAKNVFIVKEVPFSAALKRSYEIGIQQNKKWTLCTDADILIKKDSINPFIDFANNLKSSAFKIYPYFVDKQVFAHQLGF